MNYWVCKGKPSNDFQSELKRGKTATWHNHQRLPERLSKGDIVFVWESSPHRRLVGLAEVVNPDLGRDSDGERLFRQQYLTGRLRSPLGMEELKKIQIVNAGAFLKKRTQRGPHCTLSGAGRHSPEPY